MTARSLRLGIDDPAVDGLTAAVHAPTRTRGAPVLLTPGAGGDLDAPGLVALAELFAQLGHTAVRANLPHHEAGRRAAPRAERSVRPFGQLLAAAQDELDEHRPWIVGGKSYGGRVASMAVADGLSALGLVFYGYPLHPAGKPDRLRVEHWPHVGVPCLFLQGGRDPLCDHSLLQTHIRKLPRRTTVHVVPGADHSLAVTRAGSPTGEAQPAPEVIAGLHEVLHGWVGTLEP